MGEGDNTPLPPPSKYESFTDYNLHPSEVSKLVICPMLLTIDNYEEWSRSIRNNLRSKSKLEFVDGSIVKPDSKHADYRQWGIVNSTVVAWIYNILDASIRSTVIIPDDAKTLWDDLRDRYSLGNGPRIFELKHDIADLVRPVTKIKELTMDSLSIGNYHDSKAQIYQNSIANEQN
ncbi:uncharacterized protein LOC110727446 [Chenopodium quinoa]|uniref:uncharacterized protein LOC110727446 n=1 Tax=Chenopodium quinoa TaxID=63459 RepID=UPI000B7936CA|nr:uncharacterized protein LOC110727446 [Chenopodium quinoa]